MVLTIVLLLLLAAFVITIASAMGKAPLWPAVLILVIVGLIHYLPLK